MSDTLSLEELETLALESHRIWQEDDNKDTKAGMFTAIKNLAKAVITAYYSKSNIDFEMASYEYAVYLYQRIVQNALDLNNHQGRFPLQRYMKINVRHIIYSMGNELQWVNVINDIDDEEFEREIEDVKTPSATQQVSSKKLSWKMYTGLSMHFSHDEIKRLYPIARDLCYSNKHTPVPYGIPEDIREFMIVMICIAKRIYVDNSHVFQNSVKETGSKEFRKRIQSAIRSTVFFSAITNSSVFPKELLLSLDIDSLYRLVAICGGRTIRIPKERELESLMGAVVSISNMVLEGDSMEDAIYKAKREYGLVMDNRINIRELISKINSTMDIEDDKMSDPMIGLLEKLIKFFDVIISEIHTSEHISSPDLLRLFENVSSSITNLTDNIFSIKERIEGSIEKG